MIHLRTLCLALTLAASAAVSAAQDAAPRLAHIFQDNMVLQRELDVPVWGWAGPGTDVTVTFADQTVQAKADADGRWRVTLEPLTTSAEGRTLTAKIGDTTIERNNVLVGEVWIAAGQSNMNHSGPDRSTGIYPHYQSPPGDKPDIRMMSFGWGASMQPLDDIDPAVRGDKPWQTVSDDGGKTVNWNISRYFARILRDQLHVPVGIVQVAVSGTNQAAWMSKATLEQFPGKGEQNFFETFFASQNENLAKRKDNLKSWDDFEKAMAQWRANPEGQSPVRQLGLRIANFPTALYNTRIHPLAPFAVRGVIWHQGEGGPGGPYGQRLAAMANQWRDLFGRDFHFIYGTLSRHTNSSPPIDPALSWFYRSSTNNSIRTAPEHFGNDDKQAMVEIFDVGDHGTHFLQKAEGGRRYALTALNVAYDKDVIYSGPRVKELTITGDKAVAKFDLVGDGLVYNPSINGISGVVVAGPDGEYKWADVKVIDQQTIEISHPRITELKTVSYAGVPNPHETLFNSVGLPASPFAHGVGRVPWDGHSGIPPMVQQTGQANKGKPSITHVRRDGYVFEINGGPKDATTPVKAYVSSEWDGVEIKSGGKTIPHKTVTEEGKTFATFNAPVGGQWITVAAPGKADQFKDVNRY